MYPTHGLGPYTSTCTWWKKKIQLPSMSGTSFYMPVGHQITPLRRAVNSVFGRQRERFRNTPFKWTSNQWAQGGKDASYCKLWAASMGFVGSQERFCGCLYWCVQGVKSLPPEYETKGLALFLPPICFIGRLLLWLVFSPTPPIHGLECWVPTWLWRVTFAGVTRIATVIHIRCGQLGLS